MSQLAKVISIDPTRQTVEEVELTVNSLSTLYKHIGCRTIDFVCRHTNGDALIVDDEALLTEPQPPAFQFSGYPYRIHGIAIVVGCDEEGNTIAPKMSIEHVQSRVRFLGDIHTKPVMKFIPL